MASFHTIPSGYKALEKSYKSAPDLASAGDLNPNQSIEITIQLRPAKPMDYPTAALSRMQRDEYRQHHGAAEGDIQQIEDFAHRHQLSLVTINRLRRSVLLRGRIQDMETAFQVNLARYYDSIQGFFCRGRTGCVHVPENLAEIVEGVFGLDNRPATRPMFQVARQEGIFIPLKQAAFSYTPDQLADIYDFPSGLSGQNQCIGIVELGGGYRTADLDNYFNGLNIDTPTVKAVSVNGGYNAPSTADSADGEVMLDIEVAGAVAPDATIVVYFAPNTDKGFLDAITTAIHDEQNQPSIISISWGAPEKRWTDQSLNSFNEAFKTAASLGVSICAAAGDRGSSDNVQDGKVHTDFPGSSPFVLSCGGTHLEASDGKIQSEVVWNVSDNSATGGGVSQHFPIPDYQQGADVPVNLNNDFVGRGLPDVAGNADPNTGYQILVDGQELIIGGTSAVAPLMSGLLARINEQQAASAGFIHPMLYDDPSVCRDIIKGNNVTTSTQLGYTAGPGWDACTGWGVLNRFFDQT